MYVFTFNLFCPALVTEGYTLTYKAGLQHNTLFTQLFTFCVCLKAVVAAALVVCCYHHLLTKQVSVLLLQSHTWDLLVWPLAPLGGGVVLSDCTDLTHI